MLTLRFERDRETKNTVRFNEILGDRDRGIVGALYVLKSQDDEFGSPETLAVTIEAGGGEA